MKKKFMLGFILALSSVSGLAGCGAKEPEISIETKVEYQVPKGVATYISKYVITSTTTYKDQDGVEQTKTSEETYYEQLRLLEDNTYQLTQFVPGSVTNYVYYLEGSYTLGKKDADFDGYTKIDLSDATYVLVNQEIYYGMFNLTIDSETSTFPAEQAGGATITKEQFMEQYGKPGARYIQHKATVTETAKENWMVTEANVKVVE